MNKKIIKQKPFILIILDGWGIAPATRANAVTSAKTPRMDSLLKNYPNTQLEASGKYVGLPLDQDGNSEAGHMNLGAGRIAEQDAVLISKTIANGTFYKNSAFLHAIDHARQTGGRMHVMGMLGNNQTAHSDPNHLLALITLLKKRGVKEINLHLFTDGRDSPKYAAIKLMRKLEQTFTGAETINTVMGRFYAMDRKKVWSRTEMAYNALVEGGCAENECHWIGSAEEAITEAYNRGESDEYIMPYIIGKPGRPTPRIADGDSVIFFNLRSDRARQLAKAFVQEDFNEKNPGAFKRRKVFKNLCFVAMTDFGPDLDSIFSAFPSPDLSGTIPSQLKNLRQLYIAENEKYAHITFFFNGGFADPIAGEERFLVPSPDVKSYDETPEMSTAELTKHILSNLKKGRYDFTALNIAAPDMVGHTGNLAAAIKCCEAVDGYVGKIVDAYLKENGTVMITADHGNIESMINLATGELDTEHTTNPVPFILVNHELKNKIKLRSGGVLGDVAPTILECLGIKPPKEMTQKSLIIAK
ncbi:2,3-bisphosphoglycerate-independent phosphoglycerate mutase [Candidatus Falkowbacteria bacterium]|nr:2,3-bisphosphoglycerate-independent phosphoglycerate mutase [Candidatus Falkowbacteria bacterium]